MFTNAPIHDLLIRIKNAYMARRLDIENIAHSNFKEEVLKLLKQYGFISNYSVSNDWNKKWLIINLNEIHNKIQDIPNIKFYSKPSRRWYLSYKNIKPVASWQGIGIMSTSKWLLASHIAKKEKVWWELIAEIY